MTDNYKGCTVVFDKDVREDDAEFILNAIRMIKGVLSVSFSLSAPEDWMIQERVRHGLKKRLRDLLE